MSAFDLANLRVLAQFHNAQNEWLAMNWNTLSALPSISTAAAAIEEKPEQQLTLPGFFQLGNLPPSP